MRRSAAYEFKRSNRGLGWASPTTVELDWVSMVMHWDHSPDDNCGGKRAESNDSNTLLL